MGTGHVGKAFKDNRDYKHKLHNGIVIAGMKKFTHQGSRKTPNVKKYDPKLCQLLHIQTTNEENVKADDQAFTY